MLEVEQTRNGGAALAAEVSKNARILIQRARNLLKTMTEKSGVPIEPRVQTELLDAVSASRRSNWRRCTWCRRL